jgi:hypothetical protein
MYVKLYIYIYIYIIARSRYPSWHNLYDLSSHRAIVVVPYDAYVMSYGEYYSMGIPLLFPTFRMLMQLEVEQNVVRERVR